jgi:N-methylhydantoinase B
MKLTSHLFRAFLEQTLLPFDSAACLTGDGEIVDLHYETLADIGTLGAAAQTVTKYFPLQMGDVVLLNDPYSGGTTLSMMTLITPLLTQHAHLPSLYLAVRTGFRPQMTISKTLDEEGLRIPPTPIVQKRQLNQMILQAMTAHPLCPEGLAQRLESVLHVIWKRVDCFQILLKKNSGFCHRGIIKENLKQSRDLLAKILSELPSGEERVETKLDSGELIRLRLELSPEGVNFDFAGTSASQRICLTDAATFGTCFGAFSAFLHRRIPIDSGTFSMFNVTTPLGSLLNAKYPSPTYKGMTDGTSQVAGTVITALSNIIPERKVSASAQTSSQISIEFDNGKKFFDSLPGGVGASSSADGSDAIHYWTRNSLRNSVQEIESLFPLLIHQIGLRKNSGGKGQFKGGKGLTKEYELLGNAKLQWNLQQRKNPPKGQQGAQDGEPPEIIIERKSGSKEQVEKDEGSIHIFTGDKLIVSSAGGGGFGKTAV